MSQISLEQSTFTFPPVYTSYETQAKQQAMKRMGKSSNWGNPNGTANNGSSFSWFDTKQASNNNTFFNNNNSNNNNNPKNENNRNHKRRKNKRKLRELYEDGMNGYNNIGYGLSDARSKSNVINNNDNKDESEEEDFDIDICNYSMNSNNDDTNDNDNQNDNENGKMWDTNTNGKKVAPNGSEMIDGQEEKMDDFFENAPPLKKARMSKMTTQRYNGSNNNEMAAANHDKSEKIEDSVDNDNNDDSGMKEEASFGVMALRNEQECGVNLNVANDSKTRNDEKPMVAIDSNKHESEKNDSNQNDNVNGCNNYNNNNDNNNNSDENGESNDTSEMDELIARFERATDLGKIVLAAQLRRKHKK